MGWDAKRDRWEGTINTFQVLPLPSYFFLYLPNPVFSYHVFAICFFVWVLHGEKKKKENLFSHLFQGKLKVKHKHLGQVRAWRKVAESVRKRGNFSFSPLSSEVSQRDSFKVGTFRVISQWQVYTVCKGGRKRVFLSIIKVRAMFASFIINRNLTGSQWSNEVRTNKVSLDIHFAQGVSVCGGNDSVALWCLRKDSSHFLMKLEMSWEVLYEWSF